MTAAPFDDVDAFFALLLLLDAPEPILLQIDADVREFAVSTRDVSSATMLFHWLS